MVIESAFDRILRNLFLAIGIGSVVFTLLGSPAVFEQSPYLASWYAVGSVVLFSGLPPLAATLAFRAPLRVLRVIGIIHVAHVDRVVVGHESWYAKHAQAVGSVAIIKTSSCAICGDHMYWSSR